MVFALSVFAKKEAKMKKFLFVIFVLMTTNCWANMDMQCLNNCTAHGYMYDFCEKSCSYPDQVVRIKSLDMKCQQDCLNNGYMYDYCESKCSY